MASQTSVLTPMRPARQNTTGACAGASGTQVWAPVVEQLKNLPRGTYPFSRADGSTGAPANQRPVTLGAPRPGADTQNLSVGTDSARGWAHRTGPACRG
jgi:hypothetical protein